MRTTLCGEENSEETGSEFKYDAGVLIDPLGVN